MPKKKIIVISPNPESLITTSVCALFQREGIEIQAVFVKKFTLSRFRSEFNRDGKRLFKKIWKKLILKEKAYQKSDEAYNIIGFRKENKISVKNIKEFKVPVFPVEDINSDFVENKIKEYSPNLVVFTGGGLIRENILKCSGSGVVNCHMGILPEYRGMDVVEWPILNEEFDKIGITLHFMDKGVDTGDILRKIYIKIKKTDTIKSLRLRFEPIMVQNIVNTVIDFLNGNITRQEQSIKEGKQYFIMDDRLKRKAEQKLANYSSKLAN